MPHWGLTSTQMPAPPAIQLRDAEVVQGGRRLMGPVSLTVADGERIALVGRSGSGKTTTLRLVNRMVDLTGGRVVVAGRDTSQWDPVRLRRGIGYVVQEIGLFPHFTVAQNVAIVPRLEGWEPTRRARRVGELLELVGLPMTSFGRRFPHELSGGQRQRVGVARALAADPPILLCDEPFGALDAVTRAELQREFVDLATRLAKTVVFVTHDVDEALRIGHRIVVLAAGTVRFDGTRDAFRASDDPAVRELRQTA
jgi:osmoprotectant transport system ATP-binding protein